MSTLTVHERCRETVLAALEAVETDNTTLSPNRVSEARSYVRTEGWPDTFVELKERVAGGDFLLEVTRPLGHGITFRASVRVALEWVSGEEDVGIPTGWSVEFADIVYRGIRWNATSIEPPEDTEGDSIVLDAVISWCCSKDRQFFDDGDDNDLPFMEYD